jgi:hypothetical protein
MRNHMPFYAWQCLTIQLPSRCIDLVIFNEKDMIAIISLLIWKTKTINGIAGTSKELTSLMSLTRRQQMYSCVLMKYKIMKIRMKISFMALVKEISIKELIYRQIIRTH